MNAREADNKGETRGEGVKGREEDRETEVERFKTSEETDSLHPQTRRRTERTAFVLCCVYVYTCVLACVCVYDVCGGVEKMNSGLTDKTEI